MSLRTGMHRLQEATSIFEHRWTAAREQWADLRARDFETRFIEPLMPASHSAVGAMEHMAEVVSRARQECL